MVGFEFGRDVLRIFGDKAFFLFNTTWQWTHSSPQAGNGRGWTRKSVETENIFCRRNIIWSLNANDLKLAANCLDLNSVGGSLLQVD